MKTATDHRKGEKMPKKKKEYESRKFGQFAVMGTKYSNDGMNMTRLEWIRKYVKYGAKFKLVREPDNPKDKNAIKVKHALKSGKLMTVGYVPNNKKRQLADEFAPLMDEFGWDPEMYFGMMFLIETEEAAEKWDLPLGTITGMSVRYLKR